MDKELARFLKIARSINSGANVPDDDVEFFAKYQGGKFDNATYEKANKQIEDDVAAGKLPQGSDLEQLMEGAKQRMATDPAYKEKILGIAQKAAASKTGNEVSQGLNVLLAGTDIATSLAQINKSNQRLSQIARPGRPAVLQRDQMLQQALGQAQAGSLDQSKALAPAQLGILDNYKSDISNAQTAAGGQAGAFGAYAQAASNRRARANEELVPMANQIRQQEQGRYDNLLGLRQNENQAIQQSQAANYGNDLYQYGVDRASAQELGAVGRSNLRDSLTGFASTIPGIFQNRVNNKYDKIRQQASAYGPVHSQTMVDAAKYVDDMHGRPTLDQNYENAYTSPWIKY